ncbi:MAG TPA: TRAM domain-containing protein, partial [Aggregatilineales bacterium]|nr:TRAM domain-containing protein [Aggregatilineales bacterium]
DEMQAGIVAEINQRSLGQIVPVLVEESRGGKWRGRTPQNKLVFFDDSGQDRRGQVVEVEIVWTGPWSMQGRLPGSTMPDPLPQALTIEA